MTHLGTLTDTPSGTPQGAILSPLLSNVALSVLDRRFEAAWASRSPDQRKRDHAKGRPSYRMIRFADDFVVLVRGTEAQAHAIKEQTAEFMAEQMRLTLSPEKTHITHVDDGFDLLGFRIVRGALAGKEARRLHVPKPASATRCHAPHQDADQTQHDEPLLDELIQALNPILRGWANYHRHNASKRCFAYLSYYLWWRVIRWIRAKHPRMTWKQIKRRYWGRHWTSPEGTRLAWPAEVAVTRYRFRGHRIPSPWAATTGSGRGHHPAGDRRCLTQRYDRPPHVLWRVSATVVSSPLSMTGIPQADGV